MEIDAVRITNLYSKAYKIRDSQLLERMKKVSEILAKDLKDIEIHPRNLESLDGIAVWRTLEAIVANDTKRINLVATNFANHLAKATINVDYKRFDGIEGIYMFQFRDSFNMKITSECYKTGIYKPHLVKSIYVYKVEDGLVVMATFKGTLGSFIFMIPMGGEDDTVEDSIQSLKRKAAVTDDQADMLRFGSNLLLYISTGDPDLKSDNKKGLSKAQIRKYGTRANLLPFKFQKVGYSTRYKFLERSVSVRGHFRWQPCGSGRKDVKLIWIDAFSRNMKTKINPQ